MRQQHLRVALVGSSGGGSAAITSGEAITNTISSQLKNIRAYKGVTLEFSMLTLCDIGLDFATEDTEVRIVVNGKLPKTQSTATSESSGSLRFVRKAVEKYDKILAGYINAGRIDAVICISCDPKGANKLSIGAAIFHQIPIVGTGGQSISSISLDGGNVIGCSGGSVATTSVSRAVCFAASLAGYWGIPYRRPRGWVKLQSIIGGALPMLLAVVLARRLCDAADLNNHYKNSLHRAIPTVISMITCTECSGLAEMSMISGAAAGALLSESYCGVIPALATGFLCSEILSFLLVKCAQFSFLPTATTLVATGMSSVISGMTSLFLFDLMKESQKEFSLYVRALVDQIGYTDILTKVIIGGLIGVLVSWGSENGYYHTIMLPLIALEMGFGDMSVVGAFE